MKILGIETSCDETAAAVIENGTKILSNVVASSVELHQKTGGIVPEVAAREQIRWIIPVLKRAITNCGLRVAGLDAIAVTVGPGLIGSLLVGVETAKTLAYVWEKPIVPVNHLRAHLYANWLEIKKPKLAAVGLVVSGGHTDLVLIKSHKNWHWLGGTRDDAAGECFDKTARFLGLGYPGGPAIAARAAKSQALKTKDQIILPRPMLDQKNFDFSFSGLKTAVINFTWRERENLPAGRQVNKANLAVAIQAAIVDVLVSKTLIAAEKYRVKSILLGGGVAANQLLKRQLQSAINNQQLAIKLYVPPPKLCTDNAAYVASCAFFNFKPIPWPKIQVFPGLEIGEMIEY